MRLSKRRRTAWSKLYGVLVAASTSTWIGSLSCKFRGTAAAGANGRRACPPEELTPCICTRISVLMRRAASLSPASPRAPHNESICGRPGRAWSRAVSAQGDSVFLSHTSSIKMMAGALSRAIANSWLTSFSDSPIHLDTRSLEDTAKKVESASVATACGAGGGCGLYEVADPGVDGLRCRLWKERLGASPLPGTTSLSLEGHTEGSRSKPSVSL